MSLSLEEWIGLLNSVGSDLSIISRTVGLMANISTEGDCRGQGGMDIAMYVKLYFFNI